MDHLSEENVALRVAWEMGARGWSQERMAREVSATGCPMHQSAVSKIVNPRADGSRRVISVDELVAMAKVFDCPVADLLLPVEAAHNEEARRLLVAIEVLEQEQAETATEIARLRARYAAITGGAS